MTAQPGRVLDPTLDPVLRAVLAAACAGGAPPGLRSVAEAVRDGRTTWEEVWERAGPDLVGRVLDEVAERWCSPTAEQGAGPSIGRVKGRPA